ncbi:SDR family NAD(P)-dependent oxidoreductase [Streptomyces sp. NPDC050529]|uniref:SDR family NAD(P)-dependent oxidoreductase n=1 Tax=Streptomyces sp. NPDC050529 TaxID=3365624 RepID=UPI0037B845E5
MARALISTPFTASSTADEVLRGVDLADVRTIVTGASSGLGIQTARVLAAAGADVVLAVRNTTAGDAVAETIEKSTEGMRPRVRSLRRPLPRRCTRGLHRAGRRRPRAAPTRCQGMGARSRHRQAPLDCLDRPTPRLISRRSHRFPPLPSSIDHRLRAAVAQHAGLDREAFGGQCGVGIGQDLMTTAHAPGNGPLGPLQRRHPVLLGPGFGRGLLVGALRLEPGGLVLLVALVRGAPAVGVFLPGEGSSRN